MSDAEDKKALVVQAITLYVQTEVSSLSNDVLQAIQSALNQGDRLVCDFLSNGKTNYAYKVHLEKSPSTTLFAKLTFQYAIWNVSRTSPLGLQRTENELVMMNLLSSLMEKAPVVQPYYCVDVVPSEMKLLGTEWSHQTDQLFATQFVQGKVNRTVLKTVARAFATLNCADFTDTSLNARVPLLLETFSSKLKAYFYALLEDHDRPQDACVETAREMGAAAFDALVDAMIQNATQPQVLLHADAHSFNVLVEKQGGDKVVICDWEMAHMGPSGRDVGFLQAFPILCALRHALLGNAQEAYHVVDCVEEFWSEYAKVLQDKGKMRTTCVRLFVIAWATCRAISFPCFTPLVPLKTSCRA